MTDNEEKDLMDEIDETEETDTDDLAVSDDDEGEKDPKESVADLAAKIDALTKEKEGMYREMVSERKTRQELKGKVDAITEIMAAARANRETMIAEDAEKATAGVKTSAGIPVTFDGDGNPYIDPKDLPKYDSTEMASLKRELAEIKGQNFQQNTISKNQSILSEIIGGNEGYAEAYGQVQQAYKYLDVKSGEIMQRYGLDLTTTSLDEVMALLERDYGNEFASKFPGMDVDVIVEACTTGPNGLLRPRKIQKALSVVAKASNGSGNKTLKNLQFIAGKPNNLSGVRNQKGAAGVTLDDIADMKLKDFEKMSAADFAKLERLVARGG